MATLSILIFSHRLDGPVEHVRRVRVEPEDDPPVYQDSVVVNTPGKNVTEITAALDIPQRTIERWLKKLREQGRIVFIGPKKTGGYFVSS